MSDFGKKGMNKPLEIAEESEDNVLFNQQREEGNKEKTEGIADGINQCSHLSDTTTSMSTSESCYVETFEEKTLSAHINEDGKNASTKLLCKPCSTDYEQVEATQFCKTCDDPDPVCNTCAKHHLRQKLSKDHEMCTDIEKFRELEQKKCKNKSTELFCELCFADDVKVEATHFCKTCDDPDPLCETCAKYHLRQKLSKDHEMCADIEEFKKMKQNACDNMSERLLCEPCSTDNVQIEATRFCKTCDDPEPVCETCAKHHLRQKLSKDHEMCININEFRYREPKESKKDMKEKQLCEPCSFETLQVPATHYCKTCDDPELLCETCAKHHTKQKPFKDHELSKDIGDFQMSKKDMENRKLCEPCSSDNLQVQATHICKTCEDPELLCDTCAKHHTKQKPFKDHELSKDIKDFQKRHAKEKLQRNLQDDSLVTPCRVAHGGAVVGVARGR